MILEIDIGNTRIKWRLRKDSRNVARGSLLHSDDLGVLTKTLFPYKSQVERILVASVVGAIRNEMLADWAQKIFGVLPEFALSQAIWGRVKNGYCEPERLGVDRWLVILASYQRARSSCVVVDCGSAITVDLIDAAGNHQGGYIAPGAAMMRSALALNTYAVNTADDESVFTMAPGCDTQSAVNGALAAMMIGLVQQAIQQLIFINANNLPPTLYITGGDADWLAQAFPGASIVPDLVFEGLGLALSAA